MFHFGFSYIGLLFLLMLTIPNLLWTKHQPQGYEHYVDHENRVLLLLERTGEILTSVIVLIFTDFNLQPLSMKYIWLFIAFLFMGLYELYWIRYFRSPQTMRDFYSGIAGIPIAGAVCPVLAFLCLGIYGHNIWLIIAVVILGIGHIGIHWNHRKEVW